MESTDGKMSWWRGLWPDSPAARLAIAVGGMAVLFDIAVSGSLSRFSIALFGTSRRGVDEALLEGLWRAFLSDITGTPGPSATRDAPHCEVEVPLLTLMSASGYKRTF